MRFTTIEQARTLQAHGMRACCNPNATWQCPTCGWEPPNFMRGGPMPTDPNPATPQVTPDDDKPTLVHHHYDLTKGPDAVRTKALADGHTPATADRLAELTGLQVRGPTC